MEAELAARFPRVAVSHEWLTIPGGSEQVVGQLLELFPAAEVFTSIYDPDAGWPELLTDRRIHTSFLDRIPRAARWYPRLLPLMNAAFESFDLSEYDLVLSSNHACAKNVKTPPRTLHVCYCHTPMRYAWDPRFFEGEPLGPAARLVLPALTRRLRRQDLAASTRPDHFIANSTTVQARIREYYGRESRVVHPPVDVERFAGAPRAADDYYVYLGRLVPYKRADLAVAACARLGRPLKVVGGGRASDRLRGLAGPQTEFLGELPDEDLPAVMAGARALLFPGMEDFGIVPVEAQAAGVPVVAFGRGGATDSVIDGRTGVLFEEQTVESLCGAIEKFEQLELDERAMRDNARRFTPERFRAEVAQAIDEWASERP